MTTDEFCAAIAAIESSNNPEAWGDGGQAMGRYQWHPAALLETAAFYRVLPKLDDTWDSFAHRTLEALFNNHPGLDPVSIALRFHTGHFGGRDDAYAERFMEAAKNAA